MKSAPDLPDETIQQAIQRVKNLFVAAHIPDAATDARWLIAAALRVSPAHLIANPAAPIPPESRARLDQYVTRRINREPVSRILGCREFYGRPFELSPAVLDPRPDTETLIDLVLELVNSSNATTSWPAPRILDIGTGSGAILLTLLAQLPSATGVGIDICPNALDIAQRNAQALGLGARATFTLGDMRSGLPTGCDIVVANPPYIPTTALAALAPEVTRFDPHLALDGGNDGLDYYRAIIAVLALAATHTGWPLNNAFLSPNHKKCLNRPQFIVVYRQARSEPQRLKQPDALVAPHNRKQCRRSFETRLLAKRLGHRTPRRSMGLGFRL
jgi:release factor glutamine methyltransferase